jgi:hypothetical protein
MHALNPMLTDLRAHQAICRELLALADREARALREEEPSALRELYAERQRLLPRLNESLATIRRHRERWQTFSAAERAAQPDTAFLVRQTQDLIMRVLVRDRENEQGLLRRGLIPAREMASVPAPRPHYAAGLYRRQAEA